MKYSKTTLMELSHKYSNILRKCAILNATLLMGAMIALPVEAKNISWEGDTALDIKAGDVWNAKKSQTVTGALSGDGMIGIVPSKLATGNYEDTTLTVESNISDFAGTFSTTQYGNSSGNPNAVSTIIFDTDTSKGVNLKGNGIFVFNNDVTLSSSTQNGNVYLNGNKLTISDNATIDTVKIYLAGGLDNNSSKSLELKDYNLSSASLRVAGSGRTNGDLAANISDSTFKEIVGASNNTTVNGNINLNLKNVTANVFGQRITDTTEVYPTNANVVGDINIIGDSITAESIIGQDFSGFGEKSSGLNGNVNISLTNSTVKNLRGTNTNAGTSDWVQQYFNPAEKITISIEDTLVKEELVVTGGYASANDVVVNVKGNSVIGYTDKNATETVGDGWIIAGANRYAATVGSTEVNLETSGTIKIAGDVNIGSRDRDGSSSEAAEGSVKGNATLNMSGGGNIEIGGDLRAYHVAGTSTLNINNATVKANSVANEFDAINLDENATLVVEGDLTVKENASLNAKLVNKDTHTSILANTVTFEGNNTLNLTVANGLANADYDFITAETLNGEENVAIADNAIYNLKLTEEGKINVSVKSGSEIIDSIDVPVTKEEADTVSAVLKTNGVGTTIGNEISNAIASAMQSEKASVAIKAVRDLAPTTSQQVMGVAQNVNNLLNNVVGGRITALGRSSGDTFVGGSVWAQGLYNHTKQDASASSAGFTGNTRGIAFGVDGKLNDAVTVGFGYGYNQTDVDSQGRDVDVDGHNFFAYAQYQPEAWFVNGMISYGFSKYTEKKAPMGIAMKAKYDVNTYAANVMSGYDFENGLTPEAGLRYVLADQKSYDDGAQHISSDDNDVLTAVMGVKYTTDFEAKNWMIKPSVRLAATYDVVSDHNKANVNVIGGGNYQITSDRLHRFGVETGVELSAAFDNLDLTLEYNGGFREDFQSHTGMLKAKYHF